MNEAEFSELVRRWDERDRRWEIETREHREFMREMWRRMEEMDIRNRAVHEHLVGRMDALTDAVLKLIDRLGPADGPSAA